MSNAIEIQKEIRAAMFAVSEELGYFYGDGSMLNTDIHPMLKDAAYDAGRQLAIKAFIPASLFDKRTKAQKIDESQKWLDALTLNLVQWQAIRIHLQSDESIKAANRAVQAQCEDGF